jgi:hypothetical protein
MKALFSLLALVALSSAAHAGGFPKGKRVLSCGASDGTMNVDVYLNPNGKYRAAVRVESFGGSYPKFYFEVKKGQDARGFDTYVGKDLTIVLKEDRQANVNYEDDKSELDCR